MTTEALRKYLHSILDLCILMESDKLDTTGEADVLRDQMDIEWYKLTERELEVARIFTSAISEIFPGAEDATNRQIGGP